MIESKTKNLSLQKEKKIQIQFNSTLLNIPIKMLPRFLRQSHVFELNKSKKKENFSQVGGASNKKNLENIAKLNITSLSIALPCRT